MPIGGRCPAGERVYIAEWELDGRTYSAIAAYSPYGFLTWRIYMDSINHYSFEDFVQFDVEPFMLPGTMVILDGASVHGTPTTGAILESVTNGNYKVVAPYSHELSPIEKGFSLIWGYVRQHYKEAQEDPLGVIDDAFHQYSIRGPLGYKGLFMRIKFIKILMYLFSLAKEHWRVYRDNHEDYVRSL
jgi:hypothetical protein